MRIASQKKAALANAIVRAAHRAVHRAGDERAWWQATGVEPGKAARKLWKHTRVKEGRNSV